MLSTVPVPVPVRMMQVMVSLGIGVIGVIEGGYDSVFTPRNPRTSCFSGACAWCHLLLQLPLP